MKNVHTRQYKTMPFNHKELRRCRLKLNILKLKKIKLFIKGGHWCLLFNHLLRKRLNHSGGSNFNSGIFIEKSQKPFGQKSCNLCGSIIR